MADILIQDYTNLNTAREKAEHLENLSSIQWDPNQLYEFLVSLVEEEQDVIAILMDNFDFIHSTIGQNSTKAFLVELMELPEWAVQASEKLGLLDLPTEEIYEIFNNMTKAAYVSSKISATYLIRYITTEDYAMKLVNRMESLIQSQHPKVRKSVAENFSFIVNLTRIERLLDILNYIAKDTEDSVRLLAVPAILLMLQKFGDTNYIFSNMLHQLEEDQSWRVRLVIAENLYKLSDYLTNDTLIQYFSDFLTDNEPEVRIVSLNSACDLATIISTEELEKKILPIIPMFGKDTPEVKEAIAGQISGLFKVPLSNHGTIITLFNELLTRGSSSVRMQMLEKLGEALPTLGEDRLSLVLNPAISDLANSDNWRMRQQLVKKFMWLGEQLGEEYFTNHFLNYISMFANDVVHAVRISTTDMIYDLTRIFGINWLMENVKNVLQDLCDHDNYIQRNLLSTTMIKLCDIVPIRIIENVFIQWAEDLSMNQVANVRLYSVYAFAKILQYVDRSSIEINLAKLIVDDDPDVKYFAKENFT